jgi:GNAT superfamily N-acetyltransferase
MNGERMVEIKKAESNDKRELTRLAIEAFTEDKNKYGQFPPFIDIEKNALRYIDKGFIFKIIKEDRIIGGAVIFKEGTEDYSLGTIFICPPYQNQGIGKTVMSLIEAEFPNARRWRLDTPHLSFRNHHFYEKMGYIKVGEEFPNKNDKDFKLFLYEKRIG